MYTYTYTYTYTCIYMYVYMCIYIYVIYKLVPGHWVSHKVRSSPSLKPSNRLLSNYLYLYIVYYLLTQFYCSLCREPFRSF